MHAAVLDPWCAFTRCGRAWSCAAHAFCGRGMLRHMTQHAAPQGEHAGFAKCQTLHDMFMSLP
jgi:hypothetical protein